MPRTSGASRNMWLQSFLEFHKPIMTVHLLELDVSYAMAYVKSLTVHVLELLCHGLHEVTDRSCIGAVMSWLA